MVSSVSWQDEPNQLSAVTGYPSGKMELHVSCLLGITHPRKPNNKSFTDQACSAKIAGDWPCSFFNEFIDLNSVLVHKHAKTE